MPFVVLLLIIMNFSYTLYPNDTNTLRFIFLEVSANGFLDARTYLYFIGFKFCILGGLLFWFFTETKWYKYALLSGIIVVVNQFYNIAWSESERLDEFELQESGLFLFSILLGLILISHTAHNQAQIRFFMFNSYKDIERSVANRFKNKQHYIDAKRREFSTSKTNLDELKKIREQLEQVVKRG